MTTDLRGQSWEVGSDDLVSAVKERNDRWRGEGLWWGRCEGHRAGKWEFRSDVRVKIARVAQLPAHCVCLAINSPLVYFQSLGFSHFVWGDRASSPYNILHTLIYGAWNKEQTKPMGYFILYGYWNETWDFFAHDNHIAVQKFGFSAIFKKWLLLISKDALNGPKVTVKTFITLQNICVSNECIVLNFLFIKKSW